MNTLAAVILIMINTIWLLMVVMNLPGNWLMLASTWIFALWKWDEHIFSIYTLMFITLLGVIGELLEFFAGIGGAKKAGATWKGAAGAFIGGIFGALIGTGFMPIIGTFLGACLGAAAGTLAVEVSMGGKMKESMTKAQGAAAGAFVGIISKFAMGVLIWIIVAFALFVN